MSARNMRRFAVLAVVAALLLGLSACGYHTAGNNGPRLPSDLHTIYVQPIQNATQTYRVGQTFTEALVRELRERTNYRIITSNDGSADAVLGGTITSITFAPLTFDSATGRVSTSLLAVALNAKLTEKDGKVLWNNPNFFFSEQYQLSTDPSSFFEEEEPAMQRMATSFSKTLVANILEAF